MTAREDDGWRNQEKAQRKSAEVVKRREAVELDGGLLRTNEDGEALTPPDCYGVSKKKVQGIYDGEAAQRFAYRFEKRGEIFSRAVAGEKKKRKAANKSERVRVPWTKSGRSIKRPDLMKSVEKGISHLMSSPFFLPSFFHVSFDSERIRWLPLPWNRQEPNQYWDEFIIDISDFWEIYIITKYWLLYLTDFCLCNFSLTYTSEMNGDIL